MSDLRSVVDSALAHSERCGAESELWVSRRETESLKVTDGVLEQSGLTTSVMTVATAWRDGREGCAVVHGDDAGPRAVDEALSAAELLPPRARVARKVAALEPVGSDGPARRVEVERLRALPSVPGHELELTVDVERTHTAFGESGGGYLEQRSSLASVHARITTRGASLGHLTMSFVDSSVDGAIEAAGEGLPALHRVAAALSDPVEEWTPPSRVLLHGSVVARMLVLLVPSFQLDSVLQGRSRLADRLGERVAVESFSLVDDPTGASTPVTRAFDDEGTPTRPVRLVTRGRLTDFLSDVRNGDEAGRASNGCGWRPAGGGETVIRPMALVVEWSGPARPPDEEVLEVVDATGMHISNDVTGEFSFSATGVLRGPDDRPRNAGSFTVAGNVVDLLHHIVAADGPSYYVRRSVGMCGSPSLWVEGLTIGR